MNQNHLEIFKYQISKQFLHYVRHASIFTHIITSWVFVYTILNIFGFNDFYFNETSNDKIMSTIATSLAFNIIVRVINLVIFSQKEHSAISYKPGEIGTKVIHKFNVSKESFTWIIYVSFECLFLILLRCILWYIY